MSLATNITDLATRIATEIKSLRTLTNGNAADLSALTTTAKNNLVAAINEIRASVAGAGSGDMQKATYDTNNDGKVDTAAAADAAPWAGITGKPTTFPATAHTHPAGDITGTLVATQIPSLDASKIATGTIDPARMPFVASGVQVVSTGSIANLTAAQQTEVVKGATVTTTDGRRWLYSGAGSKTVESSYIELADVTPDWTVIANKPTTFAPSTHSHVIGDVTGLQGALDLKQNAADVGNTATNFVTTFEAGLV